MYRDTTTSKTSGHQNLLLFRILIGISPTDCLSKGKFFTTFLTQNHVRRKSLVKLKLEFEIEYDSLNLIIININF